MSKTIRIPVWCVEHGNEIVFYAAGEAHAKQLAAFATLAFKPFADAKVFTHHGYSMPLEALPWPYRIFCINTKFEAMLLALKGVGPKSVYPLTRPQ